MKSRRRKGFARGRLLGVTFTIVVPLPWIYYSTDTSSKRSRDNQWDILDVGVPHAHNVALLRVGERRKSEFRHSSREMVICAYDNDTLHLAWIQIQVLRRYHGMTDDLFMIYHADELDSTMATAMQSVTSLPGVRMKNLKAWVESAYPDTNIHNVLKPLRSFVCKHAALLASPYDITALIDLDVILAQSPWNLLSHSLYKRSGRVPLLRSSCALHASVELRDSVQRNDSAAVVSAEPGATNLPPQLTER